MWSVVGGRWPVHLRCGGRSLTCENALATDHRLPTTSMEMTLKLLIMMMLTSPLLAASRNAAPTPINISASQRLSTLAAQYKGKLSPELLEKVAAGPQRVEIIELLHEPAVPLPQKLDFSYEPLAAWMAAADDEIESVLQAVPASELKSRHRYRTIN